MNQNAASGAGENPNEEQRTNRAGYTNPNVASQQDMDSTTACCNALSCACCADTCCECMGGDCIPCC